jgi:hypothetical protein
MLAGRMGAALRLVAIALVIHTQRAAGGQPGALRGVVNDSTGAPIQGADVAIVALHRLVQTDARGRFSFTALPTGDVELSVRRLGYAPRVVHVAVSTGGADSTVIALTELPNVLPGVTASGQRARLAIEQFYQRRARGSGTFFTRDEIVDRHAVTITDVLRMAPGVQVVRTAAGTGIRFMSGSARRGCPPLLWLDGQKAPGMEVDQVPLSDIEGIELYQGTATTPAQFSQSTSTTCGTIVIWTRLP